MNKNLKTIKTNHHGTTLWKCNQGGSGPSGRVQAVAPAICSATTNIPATIMLPTWPRWQLTPRRNAGGPSASRASSLSKAGRKENGGRPWRKYSIWIDTRIRHPSMKSCMASDKSSIFRKYAMQDFRLLRRRLDTCTSIISFRHQSFTGTQDSLTIRKKVIASASLTF